MICGGSSYVHACWCQQPALVIRWLYIKIKKGENLKISEFIFLTAEQRVVNAGSAYRCTRVVVYHTLI